MISTRRALRQGFFSMSLVTASALGAIAGCGSDDDDTANATTGAQGDGGTAPTLEAGSTPDDAAPDVVADAAPASIVNANTTDVSLYSGASGLFPTAPDGSACDLPSETYTLTLATQAFTYRLCSANDAGPYVLTSGTLTLSAADFATFSGDLQAMVTSPATACAADESADTIAVSDADGTVTYSSCGGMTATGFAASLMEAAKLAP